MHYSIVVRLTEFQTKTSNKPCIGDILSFAETQYRHPYSIEESSGVDTKIRVFSLLLLLMEIVSILVEIIPLRIFASYQVTY